MKAQKPATAPGPASQKKSPTRSSTPSPSRSPALPPVAKSTDTTADLLALSTSDLYDRLARWVFDASPSEIASFYQSYRDREDRDQDIIELLFIGWTQVDPESALLAVSGSEDLQFAYWAWACHDPAKALATAIERDEGIKNVAEGIGQFHPQWLVENFESIPQSARQTALMGLAHWPDTQTPELTVPFLVKLSRVLPDISLLALARQDPALAYLTLKEAKTDGYGARNQTWRTQRHISHLLATLAAQDPQLLDELAPSLKSPVDKKAVQSLLFNRLLEEDPEAARARLEETPHSWLKDELEVTYAKHLLTTDPEKAFDYALDLFAGDLSNLLHKRQTEYPGGSSSSIPVVPGAKELISSLFEKDPERLLNGLPDEQADPSRRQSSDETAFNIASNLWARKDLEGFADWVLSNQDTPKYSAGAIKMVESLKGKGEYGAAIEWAESIPIEEGKRNTRLQGAYREWLRKDLEGAVAWRLSDDFGHNPKEFPLPEED